MTRGKSFIYIYVYNFFYINRNSECKGNYFYLITLIKNVLIQV